MTQEVGQENVGPHTDVVEHVGLHNEVVLGVTQVWQEVVGTRNNVIGHGVDVHGPEHCVGEHAPEREDVRQHSDVVERAPEGKGQRLAKMTPASAKTVWGYFPTLWAASPATGIGQCTMWGLNCAKMDNL